MKYNPQIHHRRSIRLKGYDYSQAGLYFITICCQGRQCRFGKIENNEMILNEYGMVAYDEWGKLPKRYPHFELDVFQIMPNHMHGIIVLNNVGATLAVAQNAVAQNNTTDKPVGAGFTPVQNDDKQNAVAQNAVAQNNTTDKSVGAGFTPVQNDDKQNDTGQPQGLPLQNINGDTATAAPTIGNIVGAYKSLVTNVCIDICNSQNIRLGKIWQRNYHEHIIRNEQSYHNISNYIINNPAKWNADKFYKI